MAPSLLELIRRNALLLMGTGATTAVIAFLIHRWKMKQQIDLLSRELSTLRTRFDEIACEIQEIRETVSKSNASICNSVDRLNRDVDLDSSEEDIFEEAEEGELPAAKRSQQQLVQGVSGGGGDVQFYSNVDRLLDGGDSDARKARELLLEQHTLQGSDANLLWRLVKATYSVAQVEGAAGRQDNKRALVYEALDHASTALQCDPSNSNVHKWYAIAIGSVRDYEGYQKQLEYGYKFKEHMEHAIKLNPKDPSVHHLMGRWNYGVSQVSWPLRQAAARYFGITPSETLDNALNNFLKAHELGQGKWKDNYLYIAKCHIAKSNYREAVTWLDRASRLECRCQDDRISQAEIEGLLRQYGAYRL